MAQVLDRNENQQLRSEISAMKKAATRLSKNPEKARRFLVKGGFITEKTGKLTKRYGG